MFGKHYASMYTGSLIGAGVTVFAVMGYVVANQKPDEEMGFQVELNPKLMGLIFGEDQALIQEAIDFLCQPDPASRTPAEDGRRLVKIGTYDYRVVNGRKYLLIRNEAHRRKQNRDAQARYRAKKSGKKVEPSHGPASLREALYEKEASQ